MNWRIEQLLKQESPTLADFVRIIARDVLWSIEYHEEQVALSNKHLSFLKQMLKRGDYTEFTLEDLNEEEDSDESDDAPEDAIAFVRRIAWRALNSVLYHEEELRKAHIEFAAMKACMARCNLNFTTQQLHDEDEQQLKKFTEEKRK